MKKLLLLLALALSAPAPAAPSNKTLNLSIYSTTAPAGYRSELFPVSGQNGKVLGVTAGAWAFVTPSDIAAVWGGVTGTLSNQTDLAAALGLKAPLAGPTFTGTVTGGTFAGSGASLTALNAAQLTSGTVPDARFPAALSAFAPLTPAADRLPYYTGAGSGTQATFTAAGRALIAGSDAAAQRTTLGLGAANDVTFETLSTTGSIGTDAQILADGNINSNTEVAAPIIIIRGAGAIAGAIHPDLLTALRDFQLPDAAGTLALTTSNITGSAATLTTQRAIYGNNFDGSAALAQIIASPYGGTGNGFAKFSGPATSEKTFILPNANAAILTDNAAVTVAQGGTAASTAAGARTNLGLVIGTDVLAPSGSGASLTALNGSEITSGTVAAARVATLNQSTTGSAATLTTPRAIYGNNFDGSAALAQIIASTYGGTGNGFTAFTGPTTTAKTFTLPNASAVVLTDNATVTVAQGGTAASTAAGARTNLGLVIGTDVLAPSGSGASLTALNATQLTSGTVPDARFPATLPAASGVNLTALNATQLTTGTVPDARFPATLPAGVTGSSLTSVGTLASLTTSGIVQSPQFNATGNLSAAAWTTNGIRFYGTPGTLTDTSSTGTVAAAYTNKFGGNTISGTSAPTFTNYTSLYVSDPVAGTATLTNKWALGGDSLRIGTSNQLTVSNAGVLTLNAAGVLGTPAALTLTNATGLPLSTGVTGIMPSANGGAGTVSGILKANGAGSVSAAAAGTDYLAPSGSGASLTALNATQLTSGTVPDARFPATLPAASGANLTSLTPGNITAGTRLWNNLQTNGSTTAWGSDSQAGVFYAQRSYTGTWNGTVFQAFGDGTTATGTSTASNPTDTEPGMLNMAANASTGSDTGVGGTNPVWLLSRDMTFVTVIKLVETTSVRYWFGIVTTTATTHAGADSVTTDHVAFRYSTDVPDTNWQCVSADGTTQAGTDSGVAVSTAYVKFAIQWAASTRTALYYINGNLVATRTSNTPRSTGTALARFICYGETRANTAKNLRVQRVYLAEKD